MLALLALGQTSDAHAEFVAAKVVPLRTAALKTQLKRRSTRRQRILRRRRVRLPLRRRSVGWGSGERLTYRVRLGSIAIGRSAISVGAARQQAIKLRGIGETLPLIQLLYRLREEVVTVADLGGLRPRRTISVQDKGQRRRKVVSQHAATVVQQSIERTPLDAAGRNKRRQKRKRRFRRRPLDALTAFYYLRSVDLAREKTIDLALLAGTALHQVRLEVKGTEELVTALGPRRCIRLHGWAWRIDDSGGPLANKPRRRVLMWLTADRAQVPVRAAGDTDLGYVTAELSSYRPPPARLVVRLARP